MASRNSRRRADAGAGATVRVQRAGSAGRAPAAALVASWARAAGAPPGATLTVRLVGRLTSARLNATFRGQAGPTNVLAFPAGPMPAADEPELGDLVVCLPLVAEEARAQGKPQRDHLAHLVVHGTLHLLGHDHDRPAKARKMEAAEIRILRGLGVPDPYRPGRQVSTYAVRRKRT